MPRCETCGRSLDDPSDLLPYCPRCLSDLGLGKATRDYLEGLIQPEPEKGGNSESETPEV